MLKILKKLIVPAIPVIALTIGGCASDGPDVITFDPITPRPALNSVADDTLFVAQMSGPGGFTYDLPQGYRYYLVDLEADSQITSDVASRRGKLEVGKDGATFRGKGIWKGDTQGATKIGLFISPRPEQTEGKRQ